MKMTVTHKLKLGVKMKRARWDRISSWLLLTLIGTWAPTANAQAAESAPPVSRSQSEAGNDKEPQKASGVVPPGTKIVPQMPAAGAPRPFEFPKAASKTLSNGLRVFVVTDHREPAVAARLVLLSAGSVKDSPSAPGVAQMTANLLTQGTEKRSAREIAETIDFVGGTLQASAGRDSTTVTLDVVKKDVGVGMDLMADIVLHPAFAADELERQRQQVLSNLQVQYADPDYLATLVLGRALYGGSGYGLPEEGTPGTVKKFKRDDLNKFHDAHYGPNEALLGFAGDITPDEAFAVAEKYFGLWQKVNAAGSAPLETAATAGRRVWLIDKPDAVQTQIRVGKLSIRRNDPDYLPLEVTNHIFGGSYNSRLNTEVRIKKGLTYGASSYLNAHLYAGSVSVNTFTRTETTVEATKLVLNLLSGMANGEINQKELDFARDFLAGVYPISSETAEQVADRVLTVAAFNLPSDYNQTYPAKIRSTSLDEVQATARKYFTAKDVDIVLAGNVAAFRDALKNEFPDAQYVEIPFDQIDVTATDLRAVKLQVEAASPESLAQGKQILLAAAQAAGGDSLKSVTTLDIAENGKIHNPSGDQPLSVKWQVAYPDHSYGEVNLGSATILQVCDGKSSWLKFPNSVRDTTDVIGEFKRGISLFGGGWGIYQQVLAGNLSGQAVGEEQIGDKKALGVTVQMPFAALKLYFDPDSHLLVAARYESKGEQGEVENEQHWSDYRNIDGHQFAFATETYRSGLKLFESVVESVQINPKIDPAIFTKPVDAPPAK
jgi:zinc protease